MVILCCLSILSAALNYWVFRAQREFITLMLASDARADERLVEYKLATLAPGERTEGT